MKKVWIVILVIVIILGIVGYLGRHKIKSMMGMTPAPTGIMETKQAGTASATVPSDNIYLTKMDASKGSYITDFQGMTLYIFDKDTKDTSTCYSTCATLWPPYTSGATAQSQFPTNIGVITRTDGTKQFTWKDMPLYYFAKDTKAGDLNGDGVGGVWHIVKP